MASDLKRSLGLVGKWLKEITTSSWHVTSRDHEVQLACDSSKRSSWHVTSRDHHVQEWTLEFKEAFTKASFPHLQLLGFEGSLALKLRFRIFNSWNLKEASHGTRTKAAFSHLQLLEFEGSLARKLRFHIFNSWNLKEAYHESCDLTNQRLARTRS